VVLNEPSIRRGDCISKNGDNRDLMLNCPADIAPEHLKELHINIAGPKSKNGNK